MGHSVLMSSLRMTVCIDVSVDQIIITCLYYRHLRQGGSHANQAITRQTHHTQSLPIIGEALWPLIVLLMRATRRKEEVVIDKNYLDGMYQKILKQIKVLNDLNEQYKLQQEEHFIDIFMKVLEKMGTDLIMAHEAYRNIDIEVKRDNYCVDLAKQVTFFKNECAQLTDTIKRLGQEHLKVRLDKENLQTEMSSLKGTLTKKIDENCQLKSHNRQLGRQVKLLRSQAKQVSGLNTLMGTNLKDYLQRAPQEKKTIETENNKSFTNRFLRSNQRSRGAEVTLSNWPEDSKPQTPVNERYGRHRMGSRDSRGSSSLRRRCQRNASTIEVMVQ